MNVNPKVFISFNNIKFIAANKMYENDVANIVLGSATNKVNNK